MKLVESVLNLMNKLPNDKALHSFYGTLLYLTLYFLICLGIKLAYPSTPDKLILSLAPISALTIVLIAAVGKEFYDKKHPNHTADPLDAIFTILFPAIFTTILMLQGL